MLRPLLLRMLADLLSRISRHLLSTIRLLQAVVLLLAVAGCRHVDKDAEKLPDAIKLPAIKEALKMRESLEHDRLEITQIDGRAAHIAAQHLVLPTGGPDALVKTLIESVHSLRESAKVILDKGPSFLDKIDSFSSSLYEAPEKYTAAAELFRRFAEEEPYADVAEDYREVAKLFDNLAANTETSGTYFYQHYDRDAIAETLTYIAHQARFLDRFEAALYAQGCAPSEIEAFIRDIEQYSKRFEELQAQIRSINTTFQRLSEQPGPAGAGKTTSASEVPEGSLAAASGLIPVVPCSETPSAPGQ
jgi:hypothetical protein